MDNLRFENFTRYSETCNFRFLEAMEDPVRIRDINGEILFENKAMRKIIENFFVNHTRHIKSSDLFFELYNPNTVEKISLEKEIEFDGRIFTAKASPFYDVNDNLEGYIEVYRDISRERNINNELQETQKKIQDDIELARNIQKSILPKLESFNNIHFQYAHIASAGLSGDLFDLVELDKNRIGVYIADVVGHGISASIMTMFIRQTMRRILQENQELSPAETILKLKEMFDQLELDVSQYFTMIYMLIDINKGVLTYVNAGHSTFPIIFNDTNIGIMQNKGRFVSSLFNNVNYKEKTIELIEGDKILMYTDGLTETRNYLGDFFDEDVLLAWIKMNRQEKQLVEKLIRDVSLFRHEDQKDDIAVMYLEIRSRNES